MVSSSLIEKYTTSRARGHVFCEDAKKLNIAGDWWRLYLLREWCITGEIDHPLARLDILSSHRQKYGQRSALRETDREFPTMTDESKIPTHLSFFFIKYQDFILHKMLQILLWFTECCTFFTYTSHWGGLLILYFAYF